MCDVGVISFCSVGLLQGLSELFLRKPGEHWPLAVPGQLCGTLGPGRAVTE